MLDKTIAFLNRFPGPRPNAGTELSSVMVPINAATLAVTVAALKTMLEEPMWPARREILSESVKHLESEMLKHFPE